jgi:hypothetical protein
MVFSFHRFWILSHVGLPHWRSWRMIGWRTAALAVVRTTPVFCSRSGMIATRGPHMNRLRLATTATLTGVLLAAGCAGPCGGGGVFQRMSMFRARNACPCECCSSCGGGAPIVGNAAMMSEGPLLEPPPSPMNSVPPMTPPSGMEVPSPMPNLGQPTPPVDPGRILPSPMPNAAQPFSTLPSSRSRR